VEVRRLEEELSKIEVRHILFQKIGSAILLKSGTATNGGPLRGILRLFSRICLLYKQ